MYIKFYRKRGQDKDSTIRQVRNEANEVIGLVGLVTDLEHEGILEFFNLTGGPIKKEMLWAFFPFSDSDRGSFALTRVEACEKGIEALKHPEESDGELGGVRIEIMQIDLRDIDPTGGRS